MNYLKDISSLTKIQDRYSQIPMNKPYGVEDLYEEPSVQYGSGGKAVGYDPGNPNGIQRPQALPEQFSKRFGARAYSDPYQSWIRVKDFNDGELQKKYNEGLSLQHNSADDAWHGQYSRTNRDLGAISTLQRSMKGYTSPEYTNPINIDYLLDIATELDRIDPNVYSYNLRGGVEAPKVDIVGQQLGISQKPWLALPERGGMK